VDKKYNIVGIEPTILSKPVEEWLNQVLSSNIDPPVFYYDPKVISVPDSKKVIVVIHVPESSNKPHMVSENHQYFVRINDSSKPSTHNQVREMFDFSRHRTDEYREFLIKRKLYDEDDPEFGQNRLTKKIYSDIPKRINLPKPLVLYSLIPKYPNEEKIKIHTQLFKDWLIKNSEGYKPHPKISLYNPVSSEPKLDGIVFEKIRGIDLISYFEISSNGYIEVGFSDTFFRVFDNGMDDKFPFSNWTQIIGYEWLLIEFSRCFYDFIKYYDDIEIQLSLINVLGYTLFGWNEKQYRSPQNSNYKTINSLYNSFKINSSFNPKTLTQDEIKGIIKEHSMKLGRGFGFDHDYCLDDQGNINVEQLNHLSF
jgi:hypothetical protein